MIRRLLITIGPQCAGKTTFLSSIGGAIDVTVDEQPGTYERVAIKHVVSILQTKKDNKIRERVVYKRKLYEERVAELLYAEQGLLLQLFTNVSDIFITSCGLYHSLVQLTSPEKFSSAISSVIQESSLRELFISVALRLYAEGHRMVPRPSTSLLSPLL